MFTCTLIFIRVIFFFPLRRNDFGCVFPPFNCSCPTQEDPFGLNDGFTKADVNVTQAGFYNLETEAFVFAPDIPESKQYHLRCYLKYCYGNYDPVNPTNNDQKCEKVKLIIVAFWFNHFYHDITFCLHARSVKDKKRLQPVLKELSSIQTIKTLPHQYLKSALS